MQALWREKIARTALVVAAGVFAGSSSGQAPPAAAASAPAATPPRDVETIGVMTGQCAALIFNCLAKAPELVSSGDSTALDLIGTHEKRLDCIKGAMSGGACVAQAVARSEIIKSRDESAALKLVVNGATCAPAAEARAPAACSASAAASTTTSSITVRRAEVETEISCGGPKSKVCNVLLVRGDTATQALMPTGTKRVFFLDPERDRYCVAWQSSETFDGDKCKPMRLPFAALVPGAVQKVSIVAPSR
jgi:hypothetical protein